MRARNVNGNSMKHLDPTARPGEGAFEEARRPIATFMRRQGWNERRLCAAAEPVAMRWSLFRGRKSWGGCDAIAEARPRRSGGSGAIRQEACTVGKRKAPAECGRVKRKEESE